jgi:HEPN domain-containing protein
MKALALLRDEGGYSDVGREAQELVELALKAMLRAVGIEPRSFTTLVRYSSRTEHGSRRTRATESRRSVPLASCPKGYDS